MEKSFCLVPMPALRQPPHNALHPFIVQPSCGFLINSIMMAWMTGAELGLFFHNQVQLPLDPVIDGLSLSSDFGDTSNG